MSANVRCRVSNSVPSGTATTSVRGVMISRTMVSERSTIEAMRLGVLALEDAGLLARADERLDLVVVDFLLVLRRRLLFGVAPGQQDEQRAAAAVSWTSAIVSEREPRAVSAAMPTASSPTRRPPASATRSTRSPCRRATATKNRASTRLVRMSRKRIRLAYDSARRG